MYSPEILERDPTASVLAVVRMHPGELFPEVLREELLERPIAGVQLIDASDSRWDNQRCYDGQPYYGNLSEQFGPLRLPPGVRPSPRQWRALCITRQRAQEVQEFASMFRFVVDIHGCGNCYPTLAWIPPHPKQRALDLAARLSVRHLIQSHDTSLIAQLRKPSLALEVADDDISRLPEIRHVLGELAAGTLAPVPKDYGMQFRWYKTACGAGLQPKQARLLDPTAAYQPFTPIPDHLRAALKRDDPAIADPLLFLAWVPTGPDAEIITPIEPLAVTI